MNKVERICARLEDNWNRSSARKRMWKYIGVYTVVFAITFLIAYSAFVFGGKSFILTGAGGDGRTQHYLTLAYIGRYLRRTIIGLLHGNGLPLFDINLSFGSDFIGPLYNHIVFDPLGLLAVAIPTKYIEFYYNFLVCFRLYLSGLAFSGMCFHFNRGKQYTLIGAVIYVFSGYAMYCAAYHPNTFLPLIELPLIIWGADLILHKRSPYIFVFSLFLAAMDSIYWLYMMTIMMALYMLLVGLEIYGRKGINELISVIAKGVCFYLLGLGLAAVILVPGCLLFFECGRSGFTNTTRLLSYGKDWVLTRLAKTIAPIGGWENLSMAAITMLATVLCLARKKAGRGKAFKALIIISLLAMITPLAGYIMNGFQYPSDRWTFGVALLLSYVTVLMLPELTNLSRKGIVVCSFTVLAYAAFILCQSKQRTEQNLIGLVFLSSSLLVFLLCSSVLKNTQFSRRFMTAILLAVVILNVGVNGIYKYSPSEGNEISGFPNITARTHVLESALELKIKPYLSGDPGRVDSTSLGTNHNMVWQVPTLNGYWSVMNGNIIDYFIKTEANEKTISFRIKGSDQRAISTTLLSTKYFIDSEKKIKYVPYGYEYIDDADGYMVFENKYALPWGYTYDKTISYDELDDMGGVEKQEAMLQSVAIESNLDADIEEIQFDEFLIPYTYDCDGCQWENGELVVSKNNATITLSFDGPTKVEQYVRFEGFDINNNPGLSDIYVTVSDDSVSKGFTALSTLRDYYFGCEDYLVNLGYSDEERTSCVLTFPSTGTFKLKELQLIALPMDNYPERVEALREEPLENIQWGTNSLTGTVDLSKDKILCVSVPYSKGWTATVDGDEVEILKGNYMFMCLPLTAGHHDIEFHYCSPGIKLGAVVTVCSAGIVISMLVHDRKKKKTA